MIRSKSIAELYNEEQREQLCKWCRETGYSDYGCCVLTKTTAYESEAKRESIRQNTGVERNKLEKTST